MEALSFYLSIGLLCVIIIAPLLRPPLALMSWVIMFPLEQVLQGLSTWFMANSLLVNALVALVVGLAALRTVLFRGEPVSSLWNYGSLASLLLVAFAGASIVWSADRRQAIEFVSDRGPYLCVVFFLLPLTLTNFQQLREVRWWICSLGIAVALALVASGVFRFYGARMVVVLGGANRGNPLAIAELGGTMFVLALMSRDVVRSSGLVVLRISAGVIGLGLIVLSGSRGQLIAVAIACFVCFPFAVPLKNPRAVIGTMLGGLVGALVISIALSVFVSAENIGRWSLMSIAMGSEDRLSLVVRYFEVWIRLPLAWVIGVGTMSFYNLGGGISGFVENIAVEILIEEGIIAFALFVSIWVVMGRRIAAVVRSMGVRGEDRVALLMWLAVTLFYLVVGLKSYCVWSAYPLWLCIALMFKQFTWIPSMVDDEEMDSELADGAELESELVHFGGQQTHDM